MTNRKSTFIATVAIVIGSLLLSWLPASRATGPSWTFRKIADTTDRNPDRPEFGFGIWQHGPALDGGIVVFPADDNLWAADTSTGSLTKLVGRTTPIPDGTGNFDTVPWSHFRMSHGTVVFRGTGDGNQAGYYAVPAGGGGITMLVNQSTPVPGEEFTFGINGIPFDFNLDPGHLVFGTQVGSQLNVYAVPVTGGPVTVVANSKNFQICEDGIGFGQFVRPDLSGQTVVMKVGNNVAGAAIYTAPLSGFQGVPHPCAEPRLRVVNATRVASVNTPVPEDPRGRNFDGFSFGDPLIDGDVVVFEGAVPAACCDVAGLYSYSPATGVRKLVDTNTPVPDGTGTFRAGGAFALDLTPAYSISDGQVVFLGVDAAGKIGLYLVPATGGPVTKIIAEGDSLGDGRTVTGLNLSIQVDSLSGNQLAFWVRFNPGGHDGIYVATMSAE